MLPGERGDRRTAGPHAVLKLVEAQTTVDEHNGTVQHDKGEIWTLAASTNQGSVERFVPLRTRAIDDRGHPLTLSIPDLELVGPGTIRRW